MVPHALFPERSKHHFSAKTVRDKRFGTGGGLQLDDPEPRMRTSLG